jgi:hypothetical protein
VEEGVGLGVHVAQADAVPVRAAVEVANTVGVLLPDQVAPNPVEDGVGVSEPPPAVEDAVTDTATDAVAHRVAPTEALSVGAAVDVPAGVSVGRPVPVGGGEGEEDTDGVAVAVSPPPGEGEEDADAVPVAAVDAVRVAATVGAPVPVALPAPVAVPPPRLPEGEPLPVPDAVGVGVGVPLPAVVVTVPVGDPDGERDASEEGDTVAVEDPRGVPEGLPLAVGAGAEGLPVAVAGAGDGDIEDAGVTLGGAEGEGAGPVALALYVALPDSVVEGVVVLHAPVALPVALSESAPEAEGEPLTVALRGGVALSPGEGLWPAEAVAAGEAVPVAAAVAVEGALATPVPLAARVDDTVLDVVPTTLAAPVSDGAGVLVFPGALTLPLPEALRAADADAVSEGDPVICNDALLHAVPSGVRESLLWAEGVCEPAADAETEPLAEGEPVARWPVCVATTPVGLPVADGGAVRVERGEGVGDRVASTLPVGTPLPVGEGVPVALPVRRGEREGGEEGDAPPDALPQLLEEDVNDAPPVALAVGVPRAGEPLGLADALGVSLRGGEGDAVLAAEPGVPPADAETVAEAAPEAVPPPPTLRLALVEGQGESVAPMDPLALPERAPLPVPPPLSDGAGDGERDRSPEPDGAPV